MTTTKPTPITVVEDHVPADCPVCRYALRLDDEDRDSWPGDGEIPARPHVWSG